MSAPARRPRDPSPARATLTFEVGMSVQGEGSVALLPEPFEVRPEAVDKAAPAARAAAARISQGHRRRSGPVPEAEPDPQDESEPG